MQGLGTRLSVGLSAPIAALGALSVQAASDAEETQSKFRTVFRNIGNEAEQAASRLRDSYGLSSRAAQGLLADTGDLLSGFGFTQEAALDLSTQVNELAVDLASFTNYSGGAAGASSALTSALLGETEAAKSLGIAITQDVVTARIEEMRATGDLVGLTERQERAYATLAIAQEQSKNAIGDFARTSDSFANRTRILTARLEDLRVVIGEALLPVATRLVTWAGDVAESFAGMSERTRTTVIALAGVFAAGGPLLIALGTATRAVSSLIGVMRTLRTVSLAAMGPAGWIALLASAVGVGLVTAWNKNRVAMDEAVEKTNEVRDALGKANDRQALRSVVNDLANDLGGNVRPEFVALADQAIATAGDVEEAAEQIGRAWAMAAHSRELAALEQQQARVQAEITRLEAMADDSLANIEDRIASIEAEANRILHETPVLAATPDTEEYRRVMDLMARVQQLRMEAAGVEAAVFSEEEAERLERMRADLADLEATREELISGSTFEIAGAANIETTVIPDPETGGTDADPTGLKGLGDEPINVEVRVTRTGDDPVGLPVPEAGADGVYVGRYTRESRRANGRANAARYGTSGARGAYTDHARNFGASGLPVPSPSAGGPAPVTLDVPDARAFGEGVGLGITPILDILSDPFAVERRDAFMRDQARYGDGAAATENARRQTIAMGGGVGLGVTPQAGSPQAVGLPVPEPTVTGQAEAPKWIQQAGDAAKSFGQSVLDAATDKVPALAGAIEGFAGGGGPLGALAGVFSSLLGESEAFQNILAMVNKAFEPIVGILDTLFQALTPIVEVAVALFQTALQPLVAIIENVVAPVFTAVGNVIKSIWNTIVRALNIIPGVNLPLIGEGGGSESGGKIANLEEERQDLLEARQDATSEAQIQTLNRQIAKIDEELDRLRGLGLEDEDAGGANIGGNSDGGGQEDSRPVSFGGTPQGVQMAVAVPLMDAAEMMRDAVGRLLDGGGVLSGLENLNPQVFEEHAAAMREHSAVMRAWVENPIRFDVRTAPDSGRGSRTAFLRGA